MKNCSKKEIDFADWILNIQRIQSCQGMPLIELEDMYQIYLEYIENGYYTP